MGNIDAATRAYATAVNSAGSATRENERYMSSLEARLTALRAEFQNLSTKTIESEFVGSILDAGAALLKFGQSDIGQVIIKISSLTTGFALLNKSLGGTLVSGLKEVASGFVTLISSIRTGDMALNGFAATAGAAFSPASAWILGITAAVGVIYGVVKAIDAATVTTKELYEAADESKSKYESIKAELDGLSVRTDLTEEEERRLKVLQAQYDIYKEMYQKNEESAFESKYRDNIPQSGTGAVVGFQYRDPTVTTKIDAIEKEVHGYAKLATQIRLTEHQIDEIDLTQEGNAKTVEELNKKLEDQRNEYLDGKEAMLGYIQDMDRFRDSGGVLTEQEQELYDTMLRLISVNRDSASSVNDLTEAYEDAEEESQEFEEETVNLEKALFDANGNLTALGKIAIDASSDLKALAKSQLEAQRQAEAANFANLIAQIQQVGSAAQVSATQLGAMMNAAGIATGSAYQGEDLSVLYNQQLRQGITELDFESWQKEYSNQLVDYAYNTQKSKIDKLSKEILQLEDQKVTSGGGGSSSYGGYSSKDQEEIVKDETNKSDRILELREKLQQEIANIEKKYREDGTIDTQYYISKLEELWQEYGAEIAEIAGSSASVIADGVGEGIEDLEQQLAEQVAQQEAKLNSVIESRQAEVNAYYDAELERLEQRNEEIEKAIDLEEKLEALEKAKSQRMLVYEDGQFRWTQDYAAIAEAQKSLDEAALKQIYEDEKKRLEEERQAELERVAEEERERARQRALAEAEAREFTVEEALADIKLRSQSKGQFVVDDLAESALGEGFSGTGTGKVYADAYTRLYNEAFGTAYESATDLYKGVYGDIYEKSGQDFSKFNEIYHSEAKAGTSFKRDPSSYTLEELPSMVALAQETVDAFGKTKFNQYSYARSGYATGTKSATFGLHMLGEHGRELGVLSEGDGVIPNNLTENLMKLGQYSPADLVKSVKATAIGGAGVTVNQNFGSVVLPNVTDATSFINEMKNFKNYATQDAYNR